MRPLFFATLMRSMADQAVGVFTPLFLFQIGKSLPIFPAFARSPFLSGIGLVILYYFFQRLVVLLVTFPYTRIMYRIGYMWSMLLGNVFVCGVYLGFHLAKTHPLFLILSFVCGAGDLVVYWIAHDTLFATELRQREIGRGVGALAFLTKLIQIVMPAIGGVGIVVFGYSSVFALGVMLILLSCIPLLFLPHIRIESKPLFSELRAWLQERRFQRFCGVLVGKYMEIIATLLWPIFVLLIVGKVSRVGFIFSFVLFLSLILTYIAGWYVDHSKRGRIFIASGLILSCTWLARMFARGIWDIVGIELVDKLTSSFYSPCFDALLYKRAKGKKAFAFHAYKEVIYSCIALVLWSCVVGIFLIPSPWTAIFFLGAFGALLSLFIDSSIAS